MLTNEWIDRIKKYKDKLKETFYENICQLDFLGFKTKEHLTYEEAMEKTFSDIGEFWGEMNEYCWFKTKIKLDEKYRGKIICLDINNCSEGLVFIDGKPIGTRRADWVRYKHQYISDLVLNKLECEIVVEGYAGNGKREIFGDFVNEGTQVNYSSISSQVHVSDSHLVLWNEDAYQLWLDLSTLIDIRNCLPIESLRLDKIDQALKNFTYMVDFEGSKERLNEEIKEAREMLSPLMKCKNGSTTPMMSLIGHSHIDLAWLWDLHETDRKCARTFSNQLSLMKRYSEYRFIQSQPYLYERTKENYPSLYKEMVSMVKSGNFIPEGGMYVEADTNITGGESLIRQFIYGKKFFKDEFDIESKLLWLPDVFGYTAALPQIMKGCKIEYFSTQKILADYNGWEKFPYNSFYWKGIDGTKIKSFIFEDYTAPTKPKALIERFKNRVQKEGIDKFLYPFGYGDGGGGASRDHLEYIRREKDLEGVPKANFENPLDFFESLETNNEYFGELYYNAHRGVLTSQAHNKKNNRYSETLMKNLEFASLFSCKDYSKKLDELWKTILLNQFHDILPGSSIHKVYEDSAIQYQKVFREGESILLDYLKESDIDCLTVYNFKQYSSIELVEIKEGWNGAKDEFNQKYDYVVLKDKKYIYLQLEAYSSIVLYDAKTNQLEMENVYEYQTNDKSFRFNEDGSIEIKNHLTNLSLTINCIKMYKDNPRIYDAWDIDSMYLDEEVKYKHDFKTKLEKTKIGLFGTISGFINHSSLNQEIFIPSNGEIVYINNHILWSENHKLIKACNSSSVEQSEMINEIQFGFIKRPVHHSTNAEKAKYEVLNHRYSALGCENLGFAVINDSKYGISGSTDSLNLTLLKSAKAPDETADMGLQDFKYAIYPYQGPISNSQVLRYADEVNNPFVVIKGEGKKINPVVEVDNGVISAIKRCKDGILVRLYEPNNQHIKCTISPCFDKYTLFEASMVEDDLKKMNETFVLEPFKIKTIVIKKE